MDRAFAGSPRQVHRPGRLLFFEWISDTWDCEHAQAVTGLGDTVSGEEDADYHRFLRRSTSSSRRVGRCRW